MPLQVWSSLANGLQTSGSTTGAAYASSTSLTDVSPGGNTAGQAFSMPLPLIVGQVFRFTANGIYSTTGTPTLLLGLYYGGVGGTALAATAATTTGSGVANGIWRLSAEARIVSVGTSGSIQTLGLVSGVGSGPVLMPATSAAGGVVTGLDTSTSKVVSVGAQFGTSSASNTLTTFGWYVEQLC